MRCSLHHRAWRRQSSNASVDHLPEYEALRRGLLPRRIATACRQYLADPRRFAASTTHSQKRSHDGAHHGVQKRTAHHGNAHEPLPHNFHRLHIDAHDIAACGLVFGRCRQAEALEVVFANEVSRSCPHCIHVEFARRMPAEIAHDERRRLFGGKEVAVLPRLCIESGGKTLCHMLDGTHPDTRFIAVEPASCPSLTRGRYAYDFADTGQTCPIVKMYTLGNGFIPSPDHAGGLRYHGMSPIVSKLKHDGYLDAIAVKQTDVFEAAEEFAKLETILPAPESAHAICAAMEEARACAETGEEKVILFGLTGTGYFDMTAYEAHMAGKMIDHIPTDEELERGFATIPAVPGIQAAGGLPIE